MEKLLELRMKFLCCKLSLILWKLHVETFRLSILCYYLSILLNLNIESFWIKDLYSSFVVFQFWHIMCYSCMVFLTLRDCWQPWKEVT
jgi:hypothetical protein